MTNDTQSHPTTDVPTATDDERSTDRPSAVTEQNAGTDLDAEFDSRTIRRYLAWGGLAVCLLLAIFALIQFYGSVVDAIDLWVASKYQPVMHAAFNLVVLLASLIGVSLLVRELS